MNHASFLLTPLREGRPVCKPRKTRQGKISTHAPAGGATLPLQRRLRCLQQFLLTPLREGRRTTPEALDPYTPFLLTPLREGRQLRRETRVGVSEFLLTPLREGRPSSRARSSRQWYRFLLTPLREGRPEVIDE